MSGFNMGMMTPAQYQQMMAIGQGMMAPFDPATYGMDPVTAAMFAGSLGNYYGGQAQVAGGLGEMLGLNLYNSQENNVLNQQDLQKQQIANTLKLGQGELANQSQALANQVAMQKTGLGGLQSILGGVFGKNGISGLFNGLGSSLGGLFGGGSGGSPGGGTNAFSGFAAPLITGFQSTNGPQSAYLNLAGAGGPAAATSFSNSPSVNPSGSPFTGGAGAPDPRMIAQQNARAVPPGQLPLYQTVAGLGGSPAYA